MPYKDPEKQAEWRREYQRKRWAEGTSSQFRKRQELTEFINELKNVPCADCGHSYPPYVMDFDHVRGEKKYNVTSMKGRSASKRAILEEVAKCEVVCANCHRIRTWNKSRDR